MLGLLWRRSRHDRTSPTDGGRPNSSSPSVGGTEIVRIGATYTLLAFLAGAPEEEVLRINSTWIADSTRRVSEPTCLRETCENGWTFR